MKFSEISLEHIGKYIFTNIIILTISYDNLSVNRANFVGVRQKAIKMDMYTTKSSFLIDTYYKFITRPSLN